MLTISFAVGLETAFQGYIFFDGGDASLGGLLGFVALTDHNGLMITSNNVEKVGLVFFVLVDFEGHTRWGLVIVLRSDFVAGMNR